MKKRSLTALLMMATLPLAAWVVKKTKAFTKKDNEEAETEKTQMQATDGKIIVHGFDWGPGVDKVVFTLPEKVDSVFAKNAVIETKGTDRIVKDAFLSDAKGNEIAKTPSPYITFILQTDFANNGNPFDFDPQLLMNVWSSDYPLNAHFQATRGDAIITCEYEGNCSDKTNLLSPDTDGWKAIPSHSGTYQNPYTGQNEIIVIGRAVYEPDSLKKDNAKHPLLIWLHGQGEGGSDPDVVILGNKVSALSKPPIQNYFKTEGGSDGAYVFIAQAPTYWMDEGDGTNGRGDNPSRYTEALMDAIWSYVASNPAIDTDRIYLSGCSNGGYMTMNMLIHYPDYFAAAIPNCEAYAFDHVSLSGDGSAMGGKNWVESTGERWLTDEEIDRIKDIPIWFLASADDETVIPACYELPTYQALLKAGAENCWFSYYDHLHMKDDPSAKVMGHWVWVHFFNNEATGVQNRKEIQSSTDKETYGFVPSPDTGGPEKATIGDTTFDNCFAWLNAQRK